MAKIIVVLCVDRDDDLGKKAKIAGPVIGDKNLEKAVLALGYADPEDSDVNASFMALKVFRDLKEKNKEVILLTGSKASEFEADRRLIEQFEEIRKKIEIEELIFVSDGSQDERILPLIQSRVPISSIVTTVVKQNRQLESSYYVVRDFLADVFSDARNARVFIGLPAIALLVYAFLGDAGTQLIIGIIGVFLFVKGFLLEKIIGRVYSEFKLALVSKRGSFFLYAVAVLIVMGGSIQSFLSISPSQQPPLDQALLFLQRAVPFYYFAGVFSAIGRLFRHTTRKTVMFFIFVTGIGLSLLYFLFHAIDLLIFRKLTFSATMEVLITSTIIATGTFVLERLISKIYKVPESKKA